MCSRGLLIQSETSVSGQTAAVIRGRWPHGGVAGGGDWRGWRLVQRGGIGGISDAFDLIAMQV